MNTPIKLTNLPLVRKVEEYLRANRKTPDHDANLGALICQASIGHFGLLPGLDEYPYEPDDDATDAEIQECREKEQLWNDRMKVCSYSYAEAKDYWLSAGWDFSNAKGDECLCREYFAPQIISIQNELIEGASFDPLGQQKTCALDECDWQGVPKNGEDDLESRLRNEAAEFAMRRKPA